MRSLSTLLSLNGNTHFDNIYQKNGYLTIYILRGTVAQLCDKIIVSDEADREKITMQLFEPKVKKMKQFLQPILSYCNSGKGSSIPFY